ncbi:MAG: hypothetical protein ACW98J_09940 [Candidatus Thorarchaeota archaeon]|jgi:hypothetical protein
MASRQIHDDRRSRLEKEMSLGRGQFLCQVCGETLSVDPEDEKTFLSKTDHEEVFGMQLVTYRVAHIAGNERHINAVILDHKGHFRGHRDSYSEMIQREDQPRINHFWTIFQNVPCLSENRLVKLAFIADRKERWVLELVDPGDVKMRDLAFMAVDCVEEAERVSESLPSPLIVNMADRELVIWSRGSRLLCAEAKTSKAVALMDRFATLLQNSQQDSHFPSKNMIILAMRVIEENPSFLFTPDLLFHF